MTPRFAWLSGFWSLLAGAVLLIVLLIFLHPVIDPEDCPNYGGNGNASAFTDSGWDLYLPVVALGWVIVVLAEQALPVTWRGRSGTEVTVRAGAAVLGATMFSCCALLPFLTVCR
ncbi:hypothetical protein GCM10010435_26280 [Winogradskya consettensis]|uniref:Uncharacterized protein n=1 Tax=Winogradskya consettensis TaxID=113560 RepID=A0A919S9D3_9ACTN|nr:hypothetical protein [Actinoplanes consettensis]GIM68063.1 hypothetical protein Aco04nite_09070 [Actinoplanes consettensis]